MNTTTFNVDSADLSHLLFSKLGLWKALSSSLTPFLVSVVNITLIGVEIQMSGVDTERIVAGVTNTNTVRTFTWRNWAIMDLVGDTMGTEPFLARDALGNLSVTAAVGTPCPNPASS